MNDTTIHTSRRPSNTDSSNETTPASTPRWPQVVAEPASWEAGMGPRRPLSSPRRSGAPRSRHQPLW